MPRLLTERHLKGVVVAALNSSRTFDEVTDRNQSAALHCLRQ